MKLKFNFNKRNRYKNVALHRIITNTINELDKIHNPIDHINGNCLDNRKSNLRVCTMSDNMYNTYRQRNNSTGVRKHIQKGKYISYQAYISINNKQINLGYFDTKEKAIYTHLFGYLNPYYRSAYNVSKRRK